ncbi:Large neutral amino acids transporter small subunit 2 [Cryobacterium roopkundense]|uniref:Amino acid transporter n=1 Tax=Cryobacterium roopkundense TaxID=1001240 RepID=A0A099JFE2_9MICO|nr:APC family permease [Cryobacterium roopkundense]KGJ76946.1 Large neutral amino acids transporter small subunit 2 [Cryobacterium roopkundense]MBB5643192.1 amino acid transporter [Cryobacterium roopkundense]
MAHTPSPSATPDASALPSAGGLSAKGLSAGSIGLLGATVIGISCIAPAYTLTASLGPTVAAVGTQMPGIFLVGFIPMLLVALGYRELNAAMPDSGTSFTWATRAFGPWIGWMGGWGLIVATVVVLSNLAGVAVDFLYLALAQLFNNPALADLTNNVLINIVTCLVFMVLACYVSYRGMETTKAVQYVLVAFQLIVLVWFSVAALIEYGNGSAFDELAFSASWFNPFLVPSFSAFAAGVSLSIFIFWGWDVTLTMNEETKNPKTTPGRAATLTVAIIFALYILVAIAALMFAGIGTGELGLGNEDIQGNVFAALAGPVMGPFAILLSLAVLSSSAASLQSTFVGPARTMLAMGHYKAFPSRFASISPRFKSPGFATIAAAVVAWGFYAVLRVLSTDVLTDTILTLGMMICFYYGVTAFACVWYFRAEAFSNARAFFLKFLAPLVGGVILTVIFATTLIDSMNPEYGSGSNIGGLGLVFVLAMVLFISGIVLMLVQRRINPSFFQGKTLTKGTSLD